MNKLSLLMIAVASLLCLSACQPPEPLPILVCPTPPAAQDWGPVAPMRGVSSVELELDRLYVIERVRKMLETPAGAEQGATIKYVDFKRMPGSNGRSLNVLQVTLEPWQRGQNGQSAGLNRTYRLTLELTPHLITPTTILDSSRRRSLLCDATNPNCGLDQGVLLSFDLREFYNSAFSREACVSPDSIDAKIAPVVFDSLATQPPLKLPVDAIATVLGSAMGAASNLVDVNISTDGGLKVGLQYDVGSTHPFDSAVVLLSHYPQRDWYVDIDTSILAASVRARMLEELNKRAAGSTLASFNAEFTPGEIRATGTGVVPIPGICGSSTRVNIDVRAPTKMCKDQQERSTIVSIQESIDSSNNVCVNLAKFWGSIGTGIVSRLPSDPWDKLTDVVFPAGDNDTFYGTDLDLDNAFGIVGRSTFMDSLAASRGQPRAVLPAKCPGVP